MILNLWEYNNGLELNSPVIAVGPSRRCDPAQDRKVRALGCTVLPVRCVAVGALIVGFLDS